MTRDWLPAEVNVLVAAYKADDWNGVHASIRRMFELDKDGTIVLTRAEAERVLTWRSRPDWPYDADDDALAERLKAAR